MRTLLLFLVACGPKAATPVAPAERAAIAAPPERPAPSEYPKLDGTEPVIGDPKAPIKIVQYSDFLCPHCARGFDALVAGIPTRPDVQLVFKTFPLSVECNPGLGVSTIPDRCTLAYAAECGARAGRFQATASAIYADIPMMSAVGATPERLAALAATAGLDPAELTACIADPAVREAVLVDAAEGMRLQIRGTPTFWLTEAGTEGFEVFEGDPTPLLETVDAMAPK